MAYFSSVLQKVFSWNLMECSLFSWTRHTLAPFGLFSFHFFFFLRCSKSYFLGPVPNKTQMTMMITRVVEAMIEAPPDGASIYLENHRTASATNEEMYDIVVRRKIDDDVEGATMPVCMRLSLYQPTPRRVICELESLKYSNDRRANSNSCDIPGRALLRWLLKFHQRKMIASISLVDAASQDILGARGVGLTLFRKFCTGVGWYEQFGFLPSHDYERELYQKTFRVVRNASSHDVRDVFWTLFQMMMVRSDKVRLVENFGELLPERTRRLRKQFKMQVFNISAEPISDRDVDYVLNTALFPRRNDIYRFLVHVGWTPSTKKNT